MKSAKMIITEQIKNFHLIIRLSLYELKSNNNSNYLGMLWEIINPMIQIGIYWFVFGYGIRGGEGIDGVEFLPWMLSGITVWFFVSQAIIQGSRSIFSRIRIISKMNFPMSVIPTYVITSKFHLHLILVGVIMIILSFYGYFINIYILQLPYFMFATFALLFSISLITSTLATIVRDVQMIVQAVVRMLLYLTPILWTIERLPDFIQIFMKINPFYYIVEGYRSALLGTDWFLIEHIEYTLYFWILVSVLFLFGSILHVKFRRHFVDYL